MRIEVEGPPPIKNTAKSMRSEGHPHAQRIAALREAMSTVPPEERLEGQRLSMVMHYERQPSQADALNLANGVADVIQRRGNADAPWLIDDDHNIVEFHYTERIASRDWYWIEIRPL
ncbi:MAG: hypothetical protein C4558_02125 [Dehalococcoidia bacterium]|nr:MAG: hypothetical protein C4558_02125 [Dehalococcoidia bacterium]